MENVNQQHPQSKQTTKEPTSTTQTPQKRSRANSCSKYLIILGDENPRQVKYQTNTSLLESQSRKFQDNASIRLSRIDIGDDYHRKNQRKEVQEEGRMKNVNNQTVTRKQSEGEFDQRKLYKKLNKRPQYIVEQEETKVYTGDGICSQCQVDCQIY